MGFWWGRALVETKAYNYGYRRLTPYIRDAAIYERVTNYKIKGEDEIINEYCEINKKFKEMLKDVKHIFRFATHKFQKANDKNFST